MFPLRCGKVHEYRVTLVILYLTSGLLHCSLPPCTKALLPGLLQTVYIETGLSQAPQIYTHDL